MCAARDCAERRASPQFRDGGAVERSRAARVRASPCPGEEGPTVRRPRCAVGSRGFKPANAGDRPPRCGPLAPLPARLAWPHGEPSAERLLSSDRSRRRPARQRSHRQRQTAHPRAPRDADLCSQVVAAHLALARVGNLSDQAASSSHGHGVFGTSTPRPLDYSHRLAHPSARALPPTLSALAAAE